jgi:hypothetical protein
MNVKIQPIPMIYDQDAYQRLIALVELLWNHAGNGSWDYKSYPKTKSLDSYFAIAGEFLPVSHNEMRLTLIRGTIKSENFAIIFLKDRIEVAVNTSFKAVFSMKKDGFTYTKSGCNSIGTSDAYCEVGVPKSKRILSEKTRNRALLFLECLLIKVQSRFENQEKIA